MRWIWPATAGIAVALSFSAPVLAHENRWNNQWDSGHSYQHDRLERRHDRTHDRLEDRHDRAHWYGVSRREHRRYDHRLQHRHDRAHRRLERRHDRFHDYDGNYGY